MNIAYQVIGDGPRDLVYVPGWVSNIEVMWEDPGLAVFLRRLSSFSRLITFDKRGTGLSDSVPVDSLPDLETRMDDLRAVMDEVGCERATLFGHSEGAALCVVFAASHPDRTEGLILSGAFAKRVWSEDYPWAPTQQQRDELVERTKRDWGREDHVPFMALSRIDDPAFGAWLRRYERLSASPQAAAALLQMNSQIDVRPILGAVSVPTLVLHRIDDWDVKIEDGRFMASSIPGARLVELHGEDHWFWAGDSEPIMQEIEEFMTGSRGGDTPERRLATVLFTDVVASTQTAAGVGDSRWRSILERHNQIVRRELARWRGHEVGTAGDGFLATFDGPARGIRCALSITEAVKPLNINVRCGLHTGEVELVGDDIAGLTVHIGSRIEALAAPGRVLVSRTVKDLVAGSGFSFVEAGEHELKGVPDTWQLFEVDPA